MAGQIKGGRVKSVKALKASLKRGSSGYIKRIPDDGITIRLLIEPEQWHEYLEHYDEDRKLTFPCTDDCDGCMEGIRASKRYLVAAVNVDDNEVITLKLPKTAAKDLMYYYEKYGTSLDRDYLLTKEGSGKDTEYRVDDEAPRSMRLSRYEVPDLEAALQQMLEDYEGAEDDKDDDEPRRPSRKPARRGVDDRVKQVNDRLRNKRRTIADEDDDEEEDRPRRTLGRKRPARDDDRPTGKVVRRRTPIDDEDDKPRRTISKRSTGTTRRIQRRR